MKQISTFNHYHLGDQLVHLHFLRALAKQHPELFFTHTCDAKHIAQLQPVVADLPNLSLSSDWANVAPGAHNAWRGENSHWHQHPHRNDFARYHVESWFPVLAQRMGLHSPFAKPEDLQFDYPALQRTEDRGQMTDQTSPNADILVINSQPMSGQCVHDPRGWDCLIECLRAAGHIVAHTAPSPAGNFCTYERGMDITAIGRLSQTVKAIIGVSTGPKWTTMNIWNRETVKLRLLLLDPERVWISPNTVHANSLTLFPEILRAHGLL